MSEHPPQQLVLRRRPLPGTVPQPPPLPPLQVRPYAKMQEDESGEPSQGPAPKRKRRKTATTNPPRQRKPRANTSPAQPTQQAPPDRPEPKATGTQLVPQVGLRVYFDDDSHGMVPFELLSRDLANYNPSYQEPGLGYTFNMASVSSTFTGHGGFGSSVPFQPNTHPELFMGMSTQYPNMVPARVHELDESETTPPEMDASYQLQNPNIFCQPVDNFAFDNLGFFDLYNMNRFS